MTKTTHLFLQLLRVALGTQAELSRLPSEREWGKLYRIAEKQSLVGVCFAALQRLGGDADDGFERIGMSEMLYLQWMGAAARVQQRNEEVNSRCIELQSRVAADGFRSYIMKGQANAALYGELASLRQSGDIDIYLEGGLDKVLSYAKSLGNTSHVNELEMSVKVFEDTEVEFHYRPFIMRNPWKNKRLQAFFKSQEEACFANRIKLSAVDSTSSPTKSLEITAPTMEFNLVHQMAHIHLHLFTEGVGMRQLVDYFFLLKAAGSADASLVQRTIKTLGLQRFASALVWVQQQVFGLPKECCTVLGVLPCSKDGELLLEQVMTGGNFGRYDKQQNSRKQKAGYGVWALLIRNLKLSRFDRGDWFWGPLWRVYHFAWRKVKGYK